MLYVIGYYGHNNIGDEQYKSSFTKLFKNENIKFIDCDMIVDKEFKDDDIIVVGGGDIINNYFMYNINKKFKNTNNKIYAISVGIPFINIIINSAYKLLIFNKIFVRTQQDMKLLQSYYEDIYYLPDISCNLFTNMDRSLILNKKNVNKKVICFCLSRSIYDNTNENLYLQFLNNMSYIISYLAHKSYDIILLPFNTDENNDNDNDILLQKDLMKVLQSDIRRKVTNITEAKTINEIKDIFLECDLIVPMRFHAALFSIYLNKPFISLITTRKMNNLMKDIDWKYKYILPLNKKHKPKELNMYIFTNLFLSIMNDYSKSIKHLVNINKIINKSYIKEQDNIINLLRSSVNSKKLKSPSLSNSTEFKLKSIISQLMIEFPKYPEIIDQEEKKICVQFVSYKLTGNIDSEYNSGLYEKMFNKEYKFMEEWQWILNDILINIDNQYKSGVSLVSSLEITKLYRMNYINLYNGKNVHRSGWNYVISNLMKFHDDNIKLPILDLYIDKTFHWNETINKKLGIIPYTSKWYGFIHHTMNRSFSSYNTYELFKKETFVRSLVYCHGLIVLSNYLKNQIEDILYDLKLNIPVYVVCHPTETDVKHFSLKKFKNNEDRSIIHIGAWLRNIYSFYNVEFPNKLNKVSYFSKETEYTIRKKILKGIEMDNYFPQVNMVNNLKPSNEMDNQFGCINHEAFIKMYSTNKNNNWHNDLYEHVTTKVNSIDIISYKSNEEYDELLTNNIVFLNLIDVSACNTLIECIVRNTPLIINKHPAVVELLGENYPLYFNNETLQYNIYNLLTLKNIKKANIYLKKLNKNKYKINTFIENVNKIFINLS